MMTAMFPPAFWEQEYGAALFPFQLRAFYATSAFRRALMSDDGTLQGRMNLDPQRLGNVKTLLAYEFCGRPPALTQRERRSVVIKAQCQPTSLAPVPSSQSPRIVVAQLTKQYAKA